MKRLYIIYIIVCVAFVNANAQDITKDFFKSLPKKGAQVDSIKAKYDNDSIPYINPNGTSNRIKQEEKTDIDSSMITLVNKSTFVLRQDYCLYNKKEDELYGYNNQEQFGTTYALGIKCNGFNIISDSSVHPWEYDEKYDQFKSNKLTPQITRSWYRFVCDTTCSSYSQLDTIVNSRTILKENSYYTSAPFTSTQEGFELNTEDTCKTGTLVWFVIEKGDIESDDVKVNIVFNPIDTEMFGTKSVNPPIGNRVIGGFFVVKTGKSENEFQLAGMLTKNGTDWFLEFPFKGFKNENEDKSGKPGKLTKIGKSKKQKE